MTVLVAGCSRGSPKERGRGRVKMEGSEIADCGKESLGPRFGGPEGPLVHFHQYSTDTDQIQISDDSYSRILRYLLLQGVKL